MKFQICRSLLGRSLWLGLLLTVLIVPPLPIRAEGEQQTTPPNAETTPAETTSPGTESAPADTAPTTPEKNHSVPANPATPYYDQLMKGTAPVKRPAKKTKRKKVIHYIGRKHLKITEKKTSPTTVKTEAAKTKEPCSGEHLTAGQLTDTMQHSRNLAGKNLGGLSLAGFVLRNADLSGACLANTNLERADLREANLERAILSNANLRLATLKDANLYGAKLDGVKLAEAIWIDGHICRQGSVGRCLDIFDVPDK